ncbi:MAG: hypothetical protein KGD73_04440 [Candidatus Lokiarchaeota archaeon]|nr:hypothetical protein [Candidatus Lokiarchaeota archaeon]
MAGITYSVAEFNTIITMLGCLCATVQLFTGIYGAIYKKKIAIIKTNDILFRSHRAFGGFATTLYFLGLFAGLTGFIGAIIFNIPPFEGTDPSFIFHVWPSFAVMAVIIWKTYISYFKKPSVYKKGKWLGIATFIAWSFTWISSAFSYYLRTLPLNLAQTPLPHEPPTYLLPIQLMWLQILIPFIVAMIISYFILNSANKLEKKKQEKR